MAHATTAHVDRLRRARADRDDLALLQYAEQLRLKRERHLRDLVEQDGAAVGSAEEALAPRRGTGERTLHVAEQHRLQHALGQRGAVDRNERLVVARRSVVDGTREHFLAGAGRAIDEDGDVRLRYAFGERQQRQAFGVGGGWRFGTGNERASEAVADRRVHGLECDPRGIAVAAGDDVPPFLADHDGAGGGRGRLAVGDEEQVAATGLPALERADAEPLRAQAGDQRIAAARDGGGWKDRTHWFPLGRRGACGSRGKRGVKHVAGRQIFSGRASPAYARSRARGPRFFCLRSRQAGRYPPWRLGPPLWGRRGNADDMETQEMTVINSNISALRSANASNKAKRDDVRPPWSACRPASASIPRKMMRPASRSRLFDAPRRCAA